MVSGVCEVGSYPPRQPLSPQVLAGPRFSLTKRGAGQGVCPGFLLFSGVLGACRQEKSAWAAELSPGRGSALATPHLRSFTGRFLSAFPTPRDRSSESSKLDEE